MCLEVFVQTPIFIFLCIALSGLLAEWRLDGFETFRKSAQFEATNNKSVRSILRFLSDGSGLRNSSCIHSLSACRQFRSIIDWLLSSHLIRPQCVTGVIGVLQAFSSERACRWWDDVEDRMILGNSFGWSYLPTFGSKILNLSKKWSKEAPWALNTWTAPLKWMLASSLALMLTVSRSRFASWPVQNYVWWILHSFLY